MFSKSMKRESRCSTEVRVGRSGPAPTTAGADEGADGDDGA
jgi:hypothetical protein